MFAVVGDFGNESSIGASFFIIFELKSMGVFKFYTSITSASVSMAAVLFRISLFLAIISLIMLFLDSSPGILPRLPLKPFRYLTVWYDVFATPSLWSLTGMVWCAFWTNEWPLNSCAVPYLAGRIGSGCFIMLWVCLFLRLFSDFLSTSVSILFY